MPDAKVSKKFRKVLNNPAKSKTLMASLLGGGAKGCVAAKPSSKAVKAKKAVKD